MVKRNPAATVLPNMKVNPNLNVQIEKLKKKLFKKWLCYEKKIYNKKGNIFLSEFWIFRSKFVTILIFHFKFWFYSQNFGFSTNNIFNGIQYVLKYNQNVDLVLRI